MTERHQNETRQYDSRESDSQPHGPVSAAGHDRSVLAAGVVVLVAVLVVMNGTAIRLRNRYQRSNE